MDRSPTSTEGSPPPPPTYATYKPANLASRPLRHSRRPVYIIVVYLFFLLFPWMSVCLVDWRTTSEPWGILMQNDLDTYRRWMRAAPFLSTVAAVIALPCVAALLAHGAVVYSQRRSQQQSLSLGQLLALADGKWTAVFSSRESSAYLRLGAGLLLLSAVQFPLQSVLMPVSTRVVYQCDSSKTLTKWERTCDGNMYQAQKIGKEPEPVLLKEMHDIPDISNTVRRKMTHITAADIQENLWRFGDTHRSFMTGPAQKYDDSFWVSALPAGVTTGPLRQHSIRLNSSADCQVVSRREFPTGCDGYSTTLDGFGIVVRTCMPAGDNLKHANHVGRLPPRQRQEVEEVLFVDAQISAEMSQMDDFISDPAENVTIKCVAKTTRAFFELGNFHTGLRPSELLDVWPTNDEMKARFHDYDWLGNLITRDWEGWDGDRHAGWTSSLGPLRTVTEVLFGDSSYPQAVFELLGQNFPDNQITEFATSHLLDVTRKACALDPPLRSWQLPYNSRNDQYDSWYPSIYSACTLGKLPRTLFRMAQGLRHLTVSQSTLGVGMYLANVAVLQDAAMDDAARTIYNLTGTDFVAPRHSAGAAITLSALISIQTVILIALVCYTYRVPTWTDSLDALATMRIGTQLKNAVDLSLLARTTREEMQMLNEVDGLIGLVPGPGDWLNDDVELAAMPSSASAGLQNDTSAHHYEIVRPASPASTVSSSDMPTPSPRTRRVSQATRPGMAPSDLSSYLQGGQLASPASTVSSAASSVRSASPPPPPYLVAVSSSRDQRPVAQYELGLGAPGVITRALWRRYKPA